MNKRRFGVRGIVFVLPIVLMAGCSKPEQRAQGYFERGMASLAKHDDLQARIELTTALKFKGDILEAWRALAGIDERTNSKQALFQDLRRIVELDPDDLDARLKLARMLAEGGAGEAAQRLLEAANEGTTPSAALHGLRASLLMRAKDSAGAEREAQQAIAIDPKNPDAIIVLAAKKLSDGDADGALKLLDTAPLSANNELRFSLLRLQIYNKKRDLPQAEALLKKLVAENPQQAPFRDELIKFYIQARRFDDAERELRSRAELKSADTKAGMDVVRFLISTKGPAAGQQELVDRIKAGGNVFDYQIALAELYAAQGKVDEAVLLLQTLATNADAPDLKLAAQVKLAEIYVTRGNFDAAEPLVAGVLQKDQHNTGALKLRASIRIERGQFDSAISDLRDALNGDPRSPQLLLLMAAAYERSGKNELVERQYADALRLSNFEPAIGQQYVAYLLRKQDLEQAENVLTEIVRRNPTNVSLWSSLAQVRLRRQNWAGTLALADTVADQTGDRPLANQIRGAALAGQNKPDQAIAALEQAHAEAPDAVQPVVTLVALYIQQNKPKQAEALVQGMAKKFPDNAEIQVLIGQTKLAQNKTPDALQSFKAAIAKQPKDAVGYNALAEYYVRQKDYDAAIGVMQAGLKADPRNINFRLATAGFEILKGDQEAAMAQYQSILTDQPGSLLAVNNLVSLILDNRSDKESLSRAFGMVDRLKNANVPQFDDTVGWAQYKQGDFKSAVSTLEAAAAKLPTASTVRYHLGMAYIALGQSEKASEQFKAALALAPEGSSLKDNIRAAMK